jgi:hypothetical protein
MNRVGPIGSFEECRIFLRENYWDKWLIGDALIVSLSDYENFWNSHPPR